MNYYEQVENLIKNNEVNKKVRALQDNSETLYTYWNIGRLIVEAQGDEKRAKYGDGLIKEWGCKLSKEYGKSYDQRSLRRARTIYIQFPKWVTVSPKLSWSQYCDILPINDEKERNYYINRVILDNLSVRDLRREIKNKSFDRLSYADKENIEIISDMNSSLSIEDMIKDPIILKSDIDTNEINEKTIHKYIISLLENKFLELSTGFALVGHEYKIVINNNTYHIDLLFFNTELNSYIVVEVKTRALKPQDIGQW